MFSCFREAGGKARAHRQEARLRAGLLVPPPPSKIEAGFLFRGRFCSCGLKTASVDNLILLPATVRLRGDRETVQDGS